MAPHLREGGRYVVARFHSGFGQTLLRGQRLELVRIALHHGDRHLYTEFHFRDLDSGGARVWVVDGAQEDATGQDLFAADRRGATGHDGGADSDGAPGDASASASDAAP
jgi:hypothetical protein